MLRRFPIESKGRRKKLREVGAVTGVCATCFLTRAALVCVSTFRNTLRLDVAGHPGLNALYYGLCEIAPSALVLFILRKLPPKSAEAGGGGGGAEDEETDAEADEEEGAGEGTGGPTARARGGYDGDANDANEARGSETARGGAREEARDASREEGRTPPKVITGGRGLRASALPRSSK